MKVKVIGQRRNEIPAPPEDTHSWLQTILELRGTKGICPPGVYRFHTFEEADQWMLEMIAQNSLEPRPSKT